MVINVKKLYFMLFEQKSLRESYVEIFLVCT